MKIKSKTLVVALTALAVTTIACGSGGNATPDKPAPKAGQHCANPGDVYAHGNTRLSCGQDGRWHR
jgi:hypothetical protein